MARYLPSQSHPGTSFVIHVPMVTLLAPSDTLSLSLGTRSRLFFCRATGCSALYFSDGVQVFYKILGQMLHDNDSTKIQTATRIWIQKSAIECTVHKHILRHRAGSENSTWSPWTMCLQSSWALRGRCWDSAWEQVSYCLALRTGPLVTCLWPS